MPTELTLPLVPARCSTDTNFAQRFVLVLAMLLYLSTVRGEWAIDDKKAILQNPDIVGQQQAILSNDYWGMPMSSPKSHKSYRPITILSFKLDYSLLGLVPWFFHAINVVLYGVVCSKFTDVAINIFGSVAHGFLAGLLFATHPVHSESVANVVNRAELLAALFFLCSFSAFQKGVDIDLGFTRSRCKRKLPSKQKLLPAWLCSSLALSLLALFSKEAGITVLAVCVLYDAVRSSEACGAGGYLTPAFAMKVLHYITGADTSSPETKGKGKGGKKAEEFSSDGDTVVKHFVRRAGLIALFLVAVVILRAVVLMGGSKPFLTLKHQNPAALISNPTGRLLSRSYIYACNAWLLLWPGAKLCYDYGMGVVPMVYDIADAKNIWACAMYVILLCLSYLALLSTAARKTRLILAVGLAMMICPFIPAANIFMSVGFTIAERTLFLPSAGFCLLAAQAWVAIQSWLAHRKLGNILPWLLFAVLVVCAGRVMHRNEDWITEERLYQSCIEVFPNNANCVYNLGTIRKDQGRVEESMAMFKRAVELNPQFSIARNNYANALARKRRFDEAEPLFKDALRINPQNAGAWANYASLILDGDSKKKDLAKWARLDEAIDAVQHSVRLQPDHKGMADRLKSYRKLQLQLRSHNARN